MNSINTLPRAYTPDQVARMLQLSTNTVYEMIGRGQIVAKKLGRKVYRVPASSLSFVFTGLDFDLLLAEKEDRKNLERVEREIAVVRAGK